MFLQYTIYGMEFNLERFTHILDRRLGCGKPIFVESLYSFKMFFFLWFHFKIFMISVYLFHR